MDAADLDPPRISPARRRHASAQAFARLARRPAASVAVVGGASLLLSVLLVLLLGMPRPKTHDEFSYLLAAETYARGRFANPTHPLWPSFETMHVLHHPAYISKFPPGQGLLLAAGRLLFGHEAVGSWVGAALACAAGCWMLRAWTPPRWALLGGLLLAFHTTVVTWTWGYWGGSLAMLGGSLVLGAMRRLVDRTAAREALLMGTGLAILAATRPFEGLVLGLAASVGLAVWKAHREGLVPAALQLARCLPWMLVPVSAVAAGLALNNAKVTGHPARLPYAEYEQQYSVAPLFLFQSRSDRTIAFRNPEMAEFDQTNISQYDQQRKLGIPRMLGLSTMIVTYHFFPIFTGLVSPGRDGLWGLRLLPLILLQLPLLLDPRLAFGRRVWPATALLAVFGAVLALSTWKMPHYAAPAFGLMMVLTIQSARRLRRSSRPALLGILALYFAWPLFMFVAWPMLKGTPTLGQTREQVVHRLLDRGGRHLVLVRYTPEHNPHQEWVYNGADIDAAPIVWARELGIEQDRALCDYFRDREVWLLEADDPQLPLRHYVPAAGGTLRR